VFMDLSPIFLPRLTVSRLVQQSASGVPSPCRLLADYGNALKTVGNRICMTNTLPSWP